MNEIFVKIMDLIEKETDMPLLEKDIEEWLEKNEANEVIHAIYVMASKARNL